MNQKMLLIKIIIIGRRNPRINPIFLWIRPISYQIQTAKILKKEKLLLDQLTIYKCKSFKKILIKSW